MNGYISWEEDATEGGDKLIFRGDRTDTCYGIAAILLGACKQTGLTLEQLIEVVYTAMKGSDAESTEIHRIPEEKSDRVFLHCESAGNGYWEISGNGSVVDIVKAITAAIMQASINTGLESGLLLKLIESACAAAEKESAPADGSSTGQKEGITDEL